MRILWRWGGIAIVIGTMVDIGIGLVENVTQHFQKAENQDSSCV